MSKKNNKQTLIISSDLHDLEEQYEILLDEYNKHEYDDLDITYDRERISIILEDEDFGVIASEITHILFEYGVEQFTLKKGLLNDLI